MNNAANDPKPPALPTPQEAMKMFEENPGLAAVETTVGTICRDGLPPNNERHGDLQVHPRVTEGRAT